MKREANLRSLRGLGGPMKKELKTKEEFKAIDILGREVKVGDYIAYSSGHYKNLYHGKVIKLTRCFVWTEGDSSRIPFNQIVKVNPMEANEI